MVAPSPASQSERRCRILILTSSAELYGSDRSLLNSLPELQQSFDVTIGYPDDGPAADAARALGIDVEILPDFALRRRNVRPAGVIPWWRKVRGARTRLDTLHRQRPFDLIYSNTLASTLGPALRRRWKVPHVLHVRECPLEPRWQIQTLLTIAERGADLVICNSHYTRGLALSVRPSLAQKAVVIHNGIDMPPPPDGAGTRADGPLRVVCVGRIHPKKGQGVLVEAATRARAEGRSWELHFYGDALPEHQGLFDEIRAQVHAGGLDDTTHWHGFVSGPERYLDADVATVPSVLPEEFSLVCAEAQHMMLPVVATGPGGPSEIVVEGETGFIVPPKDADALYRAIAVLDDDRARAHAMGQAGHRRVDERFTRQRYADHVNTTLHSLAIDGRAAAGR